MVTGLVRSQLNETGSKRDHPSHEVYTVPSVESQVFLSNIPMSGQGLEPRTVVCKADVH